MIHCKIVYVGPALAGKSSNLRHIHAHIPEEDHGKLIVLSTETERMLFFDLRLPAITPFRGRGLRFHLCTHPGVAFFESNRKFILRGVDGLVFVADSQKERLEANIDSLATLASDLDEQGHRLVDLPMVMQYNKRDLPSALPSAELDAAINPGSRDRFAASATDGFGVLDTLKATAQQVAARLPATFPNS